MEKRCYSASDAELVYISPEDILMASTGEYDNNHEEGDPWTPNY